MLYLSYLFFVAILDSAHFRNLMLNDRDKKYTVEHILAQELNEKYRPEDLKDDEEFERHIHRLGNLVLCSRS